MSAEERLAREIHASWCTASPCYGATADDRAEAKRRLATPATPPQEGNSQ